MSDRRQHLPNLLCIGAPKCGTTWLSGLLAAHPQIFIPPQKELNVLHYNDCAERLGEYEAYFKGVSVDWRGDFSVRYLSSPNAPMNAVRHLVDGVKLICVVRDPIEQVASHYWHLRRQNFHQAKPVLPAPGLLEAIDAFPDLLLEPVLYFKHLSRWLEHFPREQLLVVDYRQLVDRTPDTLRSIQQFLDVELDIEIDLETDKEIRAEAALIKAGTDADLRRGVQPRSGLAAKIYPRLYSAISRGPFQWFKRQFGVKAAEDVKRKLQLSHWSQKLFFRPGYPEPSDDERSAILAIVAHDQEALKKLMRVS